MTQTMIERVARAIDEAEMKADKSDDWTPHARAALEEIAQWHSEQAEAFRHMANDDRLSDEAIAKAWSASKHHAGTAAAMRSILIGSKEEGE